jgi:hypothetical protein
MKVGNNFSMFEFDEFVHGVWGKCDKNEKMVRMENIMSMKPGKS